MTDRRGVSYAAPVRVGESALPLPAAGHASLRPQGPGFVLASEASAELWYRYWDFVEVPPS